MDVADKMISLINQNIVDSDKADVTDSKCNIIEMHLEAPES